MTITEEIWRDAVGYEGLYEVSNYGKVRHYGGAEMNGSINSYGYRTLALKRNGKRETGKGHRLVAEAFMPNPHGENINHARQELSIDYSVKPVVQKTAGNYGWEHGGDVYERFIRENRARTLKQEIERLSEELSQIETPTQNP